MLNKLSQLFKSIDFQIESDGQKLVGPFTINGNQAHLVVRVGGSGEGTIIDFAVIGLIPVSEVRESSHIGAFVQYLLAQNWRFSAGSVELDTDGELRVLVELPLADGDITANQLRLIIQILGRNGAELLNKGRSVLQTGSEGADEQVDNNEPDVPGPEMIELFLKFKRMAQSAEGRASLVALKEQDGCPSMVRIMVDAALQQSVPDEL